MSDDMPLIFVSPTERGEHVKVLSRRFRVQQSLLTERRGVDVAWFVDDKWCGVQRKRIDDFYASLNDGRLAKELGQMRENLALPIIVIEGKLNATIDGMFTTGRDTKHVKSHFNAMLTLASYGITMLQTETAQHTGFAIIGMWEWCQKDKHKTGLVRPKASGEWGKATSREWAIHFLQGFDGIGPDTAGALFDHFGRLPIGWDVTVKELLEVPGIGRQRATALAKALGNG
jgi:ERCC4-type nuclease